MLYNFCLQFRDEHRSCSICAIIEENPRKLKECYTKAKLTLPVAIGSSTAELDCFRSIIYRKIRFFWHPKYSRFVTFNDLEKEISIRDIHSHSECCKSGISSEEAQERRIFYGSNRIDVELTPILTLLFREVLNPFYIFQLLRYQCRVLLNIGGTVSLFSALSCGYISTITISRLLLGECR